MMTVVKLSAVVNVQMYKLYYSFNISTCLIGKDPDARQDSGQEEKGTTEDELVGWHHQLNGHEFEQVPGDGGRQGSLACCSPRGCMVRHD